MRRAPQQIMPPTRRKSKPAIQDHRQGRSDKRRSASHPGEMCSFEVGEGVVERGREHLYHRGRDRERRSDENVVAANAVHATLHRIRHDACLKRVFLNSRGDARIGRKRLARLRIADDFDGEQQALAPHVSDDRILPKCLERRAQFAPSWLDALKKILALDIVEHGIPSRSSHRMRVVRKAVEECAGAARNCFGNIRCNDHSA